MEFHEAAKIAKQNPGSTVTRDGDGAFEVRLEGGRVIDQPRCCDFATLLQEREELAAKLGMLETEFAAREKALQDKTCELSEEISRLHRELSEERSRLARLSQDLDTSRSEHATLKTRVSKVSAAEWERIKVADRLLREAEAKERKAERRQVNCPCLGEVEDCSRCYGSGNYTVDGYGNRV